MQRSTGVLQNWFARVLLCAAVLGVFSSTTSAGLITIDDFTDTNATWAIEVFTGQTGDGNNEAGLSGVLGGSRATTLSNGIFQSTLDRASVAVAPSVTDGVLDYNSTLSAASNLTLVYGINAASFDFSNQAGIVVDFIGFDFPEDSPLQINMLVTSNGETLTSSTMVSSAGTGEVFLNFDDLSPLRGVFDFATIDDLALEFVAASGSDFRIGSIGTRVPNPGVLAVFGFGALAAGSRRRCG